MKASLTDLSNAYQDQVLTDTQARAAPCPPIEHLVQSVMGRMPRKRRAEVAGHAATCAACAAALKEIFALSKETERVAAELAAYQRRRAPTPSGSKTEKAFSLWPVARPAFVLAAGIFVVASLIVSVPKLLDRSGTRGAPEAGIVLVSPLKAEPARDLLAFKWQGPADADHYTVEVFDRTFRLVWRSGWVTGTETRLQADAARRIIPGESYYWKVTAVTGGRLELQSKLAEFFVMR